MTMLSQVASMHAPVTAPGLPTLPAKPIRVMIVDDSAVVRGLVSRWIEEEPGLEVVARHANGKLAVEDVVRSAPDIVLLDIEMPVMDGLEALPLLLHERPELRVLMVSTLTRRNAEISFKALALGALDFKSRDHHLPRFPSRGDPQDQVARPGAHAACAFERRRPRRRGRCRSWRNPHEAARFQATPVSPRAAAHHCDRQLDRRPAGAGKSSWRGFALAFPRGAAYAAGVHRDPRRASGAGHGARDGRRG